MRAHETRTCPDCQVTKSAGEFYGGGDGRRLSHYCKPCTADRRRAHRATQGAQDVRRAYRARPDVKEAERALTRRRYARDSRSWRESRWKASGIRITWDDYQRMRAAQEERCAICGRPEADLLKALAVDHDHATGEPRGLLCDDCNLGLGRFGDDARTVASALAYLNVCDRTGSVDQTPASAGYRKE